MKKLLSLLVISCFMTGLLAGCGGAKQAEKPVVKNQLIYGAEFEYEKINPVLSTTNCDDMLFRGLMRFDENNIPQKDIAEDIKVSSDGKVYDITIKQGVKFHDGVELKAEDAAFTINKILDENVVSEKSPDFAEVEKAEATGDYTLKLYLKQQFPPLLDKLTVGIIPKHAFPDGKINNAAFNHKPIGCGPYMFDKWEKGKSLTLKAFPDYYGTKASITTLVFKFIPDFNARAVQLKTGEVDMAFLEPSQVATFEKEKNLKLYIVPSADYRCMMYNMKFDLWKDVNVRKAFNYAIDRDAILKGIMYGHGITAYGPLARNKYGTDDFTKYGYDPQQSAALLDKAGWKLGDDGFRYKNGKKLAFTLTTPVTDEVRVNIANYLADQFKKIGADVKVDALDWSVIKIGDCEAFVLGWGSPGDADDHTYKLFHSSQMKLNNFEHYNNPKVDALLEKARVSTDEKERAELYAEFQKELANDPPFAFLVYIDGIYGVNKNITGMKERTLGHHGAGFLWNVEEWKING